MVVFVYLLNIVRYKYTREYGTISKQLFKSQVLIANLTKSMSTKTENVSPLNEERTGSVREVGGEAVWSLSSCKPGKFGISLFYGSNLHIFCIYLGFGVEQLRDNSTETYWQSDGQLPHLINIQFPRKTTVSHIYLFSDYKLDESYTPSRISIRSGTHFNDLQEIEVVDLCEPSGWVCIAVKDMREKPIRTFMLQIAV